MSFTNNKLDVFDYLGGGSMIDLHPNERLLVYDGGSCVMLWDLQEDVKLRLHEHLNPIKIVRFFGEDSRLIMSSDYRSIIISEWHSCRRVAELAIPLKKQDTPHGQMLCDYRFGSMILLTQLQSGYRLSILTFKEFNLNFVFSADLTEGGRPLLLRIIKLGEEIGILVVEENCVKLWRLDGSSLVSKDQVAVHKPIISACYVESKEEIVLLTDEGLLLTLSKTVIIFDFRSNLFPSFR